MNKVPRTVLAIAGVLLIVLTMARALPSWSNDSHLEHVSGVWVALAVDLARGVFYRPPFGPLGYGGTRFFPLCFSLHAAGIRLSGGWRASGYFLSAFSVLLLLAGIFYLLRRLGADRWLASGGVLVALAASSVQDSLLTIREDGMAAMFNVWGLALCSGDEPSGGRIYAGAALFVLAFATKETSVFGAAAVVLWLVFSKKFGVAWRLLLATVAGYLLVLIIIYFASHGRALDNLRLTLSTGTSFRSLLQSPLTMVQTMNGYAAESITLVLGAGAFAMRGDRIVRMQSLLFLCTLAATLLIFGSEGTAGNHLLDLHVAAIVMFVGGVSEIALADFGASVIAVTCLIGWLSLLPQHKDVDFAPVRTQLQEMVQAIPDRNRPILGENPLVPIVAGQEPYLLDPFMFRVMREKVPGLAEPMWQMLRERRFGAVVLMDDPESDYGRDLYSNYHFGEGFLEHLRESYEPADTPGGQYLYLPRDDREH
jgi:hypothetical protein